MSAKISSKTNYSKMHCGKNKEFEIIIPPKEMTLGEIRNQIPDKYFQKSLPTGLAYLTKDLAQVAAAVAVMYFGFIPLIDLADSVFGKEAFMSYATRFLLWNVYWFVQGCNGVALWIIAHECGHQAFSQYRAVNDTIGWFLHSLVLIPYHSWRISHATHHKNTNYIGQDTAYVPPEKESRLQEAIEDSPLFVAAQLVFAHVAGWFCYLVLNMTGKNYGRRASHFEPSSPIFRPQDKIDVIVSDIGIAINLVTLVTCSYLYSFSAVACWYFIPYMWTSAWLVYITFMQHSDKRLAQYSHDEWTFVRGGLAAVDRDYGHIFNVWFHHINDSHIIHHLFSQMPFWNAIEVTRKYNKEIFGDMYRTSNQGLLAAVWESWSQCHYIVPKEGICIYHQ